MTSAALAAASGALYALALPPIGWSALGWFALAPLFVAISKATPGRAFGLGLLWFFVASLGFASPMPHLVSAYFGTPWVVGLLAFLGFTVVFGPFYGAVAAWISWLVRRGSGNPLAAGAGIVVVEWARTSAGSIFGWALLAHTQTPGAAVLQSADLGGAYLPGFVLAAASYALAAIVTTDLLPRKRTAWIVGTGGIVVAALAYGLAPRSLTPAPDADQVRVAIVQGGLPHAERWQAKRDQEHLAHYVDLTDETDVYEPHLVVWPEYAVAFDIRRRAEEREALFALTTDYEIELLFGAPFHRAPGIIQNSAFVLRDGGLAGRYDKNELLPFAERSPWPELTTLDREQYTPGGKAFPISTRRAEVGVFLCSEALRPGIARRLTANGATVLANLSNDSWLGTEAAARMQLRSAALRAIENRRPVVRATGSGKSAVIRPDGGIEIESHFGEPDVIYGEVKPMAERTVYGTRGDIWVALAALLAAGATLAAAASGRRAQP